MAGKSRSLNFILLVCALIGAALFYGCGGGGGGTSSDPLPTSTTIITGSINSSDIRNNMAYDGNLLPEIRASGLVGARVWLESDYNTFGTTSTDGKFTIVNVPPGRHRLVIMYKASDNTIYKKLLSNEVSVDVGKTVEVGAQDLSAIEDKASVRIPININTSTNANPGNVSVSVWGEPGTMENGQYYTPFMPEKESATIVVSAPGFQSTSITAVFTNELSVAPTLVPTSATNRAPNVTLSGTFPSEPSKSVDKGRDVELNATVVDPDNNWATSTYWCTAGTLRTYETGNKSPYKFFWTAPDRDLIATISFTAIDQQGLSASSTVTLQVGRGFPNQPPVISAINISPSDLEGSRQYSLSAIVSDPDEDAQTLGFTWSSQQGKFEQPPSSRNATWTTPILDATATIDVYLSVNDNYGGRTTATRTFTVNPSKPNNAPTAAILTPAANSQFKQFSVVTFTASGSDIEDGAITADSSFYWEFPAPTGSKNGATVNVDLKNHSLGNFTATLRTLDSGGKYSAPVTRTIVVVDNSLPTIAQITVNPTAVDSIYPKGTNITFQTSGTDEEDGTLAAGSFYWLLATTTPVIGNPVSKNDFQVGTNKIEVTAKDSNGGWSAAQTVNISINTAPVATQAISISTPARLWGPGTPASYVAMLGETVSLLATFTNEANDPYTTNTLSWKSRLGAGSEVEISNPASFNLTTAGVHTIKVTASDGKDGGFAATQTTILVNRRPEMTIEQPITRAFNLNEPIIVRGKGTDPDGEILDTDLFKWWDTKPRKEPVEIAIPEGFTPRSFTFGYTNPADLGTHTLRLEGVDSYGAIGSTTFDIFINSQPRVSIIYPTASGTRADTDAEIIFTARIEEDDPTDKLNVRWYTAATPTVSLQVLTDQTIDSFKNYTFSSTGVLASGPHTIVCEVTDSQGLKASDSIGILLNKLPIVKSGKIQLMPNDPAVTQYATGPENIPIFLSTSPNLVMDLSVDDFDHEIDIFDGAGTGSLHDWDSSRIKWESNKGAFGGSITGKSISQQFPIGYNEVTVRLYDTFYPGFEQQASNSYKIGFYIWQSKDLYVTIPDDCQNMTAYSNKLYFINNKAAPTIITSDYTGGSVVNPYISLASNSFNLQDCATAAFTIGYDCALDYEKRMFAMGSVSAVIGQKLAVFKSETASATIASISGGLTARSIACHQSDPTAGYIVSGNALYPFNPAVFDQAVEAFPLDGAAKTSAGGVSFLNPTRVRHGVQAKYSKNILIADTGNDRVVRFDKDLSEARIVPASSPVDMTPTDNRLLTISRTTGKITLHSIDDSKSSEQLVTFGGLTTTNEPGKFQNPVAIHFVENDLIILELDNTGKRKRLQLIRSGETDWLK